MSHVSLRDHIYPVIPSRNLGVILDISLYLVIKYLLNTHYARQTASMPTGGDSKWQETDVVSALLKRTLAVVTDIKQIQTPPLMYYRENGVIRGEPEVRLGNRGAPSEELVLS